MKVAIFVALTLVVLTSGSQTGLRHFKGYQVISALATTREQLDALRVLYFINDYDFWTSPNGLGATDIMAAPELIPQLVQLLTEKGIEFAIKFDDVEKLVEDERIANAKASIGRIDWTSYQPYDSIVQFLTTINSNIATVSVIGQTTEGRDIHVVKFSSGGPPKKSILIDSNIHAREWIAGATGTWIINELLTNSANYTAILQEVDIYVIPMINADGYEYTWTSDRMWRKTRSVNAGSSCMGCDPNRNFPFQWAGESTSSDPCTDIYHGSAPLTEPETQAIDRFVRESEAAGVEFYAYASLHSYSNVMIINLKD
ncbi:carboxypeptidase B-like [Folsomia candida]|uniref:carboxypeptidase B-like n=1 Tax=Folsomia candida TaxID=158441 RepID=UPI001604D8E1|nr:carboxypeptidase B-like [Folsomia candida]